MNNKYEVCVKNQKARVFPNQVNGYAYFFHISIAVISDNFVFHCQEGGN